MGKSWWLTLKLLLWLHKICHVRSIDQFLVMGISSLGWGTQVSLHCCWQFMALSWVTLWELPSVRKLPLPGSILPQYLDNDIYCVISGQFWQARSWATSGSSRGDCSQVQLLFLVWSCFLQVFSNTCWSQDHIPTNSVHTYLRLKVYFQGKLTQDTIT